MLEKQVVVVKLGILLWGKTGHRRHFRTKCREIYLSLAENKKHWTKKTMRSFIICTLQLIC
jgi:hypothetical protein